MSHNTQKKGPCPHGRSSWKNCPHCLGVNSEFIANSDEIRKKLEGTTHNDNQKCKRCGLLRSTILATKTSCHRGTMHDFSEYGISFPTTHHDKGWEERFDERFKDNPIFQKWSETAMKAFIQSELERAKTEVYKDLIAESKLFKDDFKHIGEWLEHMARSQGITINPTQQ